MKIIYNYMKIRYVIARYQEDVSWANGVPNCIIYNKSDSLLNTIHPVIKLPNIGREGHTYLHHIITNYDNLDDHIIFLQGNPFDHSSNLEDKLKSIDKRIYNEYQTISFEYISEIIHYTNIQSDFPLMLPCYYILYGGEKTYNLCHKNETFPFGAGAQFIVSKENILSHPKSFYEKMIKLLDYDSNPLEGHAIERLWYKLLH